MSHTSRIDVGVGEKPWRTSLVLPPGAKKKLSRSGGPRLATAIRLVLTDSFTLFNLPAAARLVLEADMARNGMEEQRDYVIWLLVGRLRELLHKEEA